jgi:hypothetical protein
MGVCECWIGRLNREHREEMIHREKVRDQEDQEGREKKEKKRGDMKEQDSIKSRKTS